VKTFRFIVTSERQSEPQLLAVCVRDEARARELAVEVLRKSSKHRQIDVLTDSGAKLFQLTPQDLATA